LAKEAAVPDRRQAEELLALDDDALRARLDTLALDSQLGLVVAIDWKDRLRVIVNSPDPQRLVGAMPDEEVLLSIKSIGEEDAIELIDLTSPRQLRFVLDVELWRRDSIDESMVMKWLHYIVGCGEEKVIDFVEVADRELLVIFLGKLIDLVPNDPEVVQPLDAGGLIQDQFFTIAPRYPKETENVKLLLRVLRQWDRDRYYELLFEVYGSSGAETEEGALRWRNSRLEEKGLLDFEEAVEIYGYVSEEEARSMAEAPAPLPEYSPSGAPPFYPVRLFGGRTFFGRLLSSLADLDLRNRLRSEIAFAANRLVVADGGNLGEMESKERALRKLFSLVNLGLLFVSGGDTGQARETLEHVAVRDLFQIGFSRAVDLKSMAAGGVRRWWPRWRAEGFRFLGSPRDEIMTGLMERVPQYYDPQGPEPGGFSDFETPQEIEQTRRAIEEIVAAADFLFGVVGIPGPSDAKMKPDGALAGFAEDVDLGNLMATGFAHFLSEGRFDISPLTEGDAKNMFDSLMAGSSGRPERTRDVERFVAWLKREAEAGGIDAPALERFARAAIARVEEEVALIPSWDRFDPRYIRSLILAKWPGREDTDE
jgi:hypothetical protein